MANSDNPRNGAEFEKQVRSYFARHGVALRPNLAVPVGNTVKRLRKFDLGSEDPPVLVECKCHVWTEGGNVPSAKMTVWNEAMYYFKLAPRKYRKMLVCQRSLRARRSLVEYYMKRHPHLIPRGVELWEFDPKTGRGRCLHGGTTDLASLQGGSSREELEHPDPRVEALVRGMERRKPIRRNRDPAAVADVL